MEYYTIPELKAYARQHNIRLPGLTRKADILNAINRALNPSSTPIQPIVPTPIKSIEHPDITQSFSFTIFETNNLSAFRWQSILALIEPLTNKCFPGRIGYLPRTTIYTLMDENKAIAVAALSSAPIEDANDVSWGPNFYYLYNVCTDPLYRGKHLQERLLNLAFENLKNRVFNRSVHVYLYVDVDNVSAIKLYTRIGFHIVKETSFNGVKAFLMYLNI